MILLSSNIEQFIELFHGVIWSGDRDAFGARVGVNFKVVASGFRPIAEEKNSPEIVGQKM